MWTELGGKGGCLCKQAQAGELRCPLIVRPTSEDVVTGNLFGTMKVLNPRWWLPDLLNRGLGSERFRRQIYRGFRIDLWEKQKSFPRELLAWDEGQTEVDVIIRWENPPTTVFIEMKYGSPVSSKTVNNNGSEWPADQLIRNARVGLHENGWYAKRDLFQVPRRDFVLLLVTPNGGNELVPKYRDPNVLRSSIPCGDQIESLPKLPFIGELSYGEIEAMLRSQLRWFNHSERKLIEELDRYLAMKVATVPGRSWP